MVAKFVPKSVPVSHEDINQSYQPHFQSGLACCCEIVSEFQRLYRIKKGYNFDFIFKDTVTFGGLLKGRSDDTLVICLTNEVRKTRE